MCGEYQPSHYPSKQVWRAIGLSSHRAVVSNLPQTWYHCVRKPSKRNPFQGDVGSQCIIPPKRSPIRLCLNEARYFLFDATLISVLGVVWQHRLEMTSPTLSSKLCVQRGKYAVDAAIQILQYCASTNRTARQCWTNLTRFKLWMESM